MEWQDRRKFIDEFKELGAPRVRRDLLTAGWSKDKRRIAREWLEVQDAQNWQAAPEGERSGGLGRLRINRKFWTAVMGLGFGAYALFSIVSHLHR